MMTDITIAKETQLFLWSLLLGAGLSVLYDVLRVLRLETHHRNAVICIEDILYFLVCSVITFGFLLKDNCGEVRGYVLIGELIGWVLWHLTIGSAAVHICAVVFSAVKHFLIFLFKIIFSPICCVFRFISKILKKFTKKVLQKEKYNLKHKRIMMYNLFNRCKNTRQKGGEPDGSTYHCKKEKKTQQ